MCRRCAELKLIFSVSFLFLLDALKRTTCEKYACHHRRIEFTLIFSLLFPFLLNAPDGITDER